MKKSTVIIMWGVITAVALSIFRELTYDKSDGLQSASFLLFFGGLLVAKLQYRNKIKGGFASFGELYGLGMLISLVIGVLTVAYSFIFLKLHPAFVDATLEQAKAAMIMKKAPDEVIEKSQRIGRWFLANPLGIILAGMFNKVVIGAIVSLLTAGITAKRKPMFENNETGTIEQS